MRQTSIVAAVVSVFLFAPFAHAVVVVNETNFGLPLISNEGLQSVQPSVTTFNLDGPTTIPAGVSVSHTGDVQLVSGSATGQYQSPAFDTSRYLAIGTNNQPASVTISGLKLTYLGFDWGSIDSYNSVVLTLSDGSTKTFTGCGILTTPCVQNSGQDQYVNFNVTGGDITQVVLSTTFAALEVDNFAVTALTGTPPVPEASTWLMMVLGFFSLGFVAYRRKGRAMQLRIA
jgi:hypothetical protein